MLIHLFPHCACFIFMEFHLNSCLSLIRSMLCAYHPVFNHCICLIRVLYGEEFQSTAVDAQSMGFSDEQEKARKPS